MSESQRRELRPTGAATICCQLPACSHPSSPAYTPPCAICHTYAMCRKPRRSSKQSDPKTGASTNRERGSRNSKQRDEKVNPAEGEGNIKVGCTGQHHSASGQHAASGHEVKSQKPNMRIYPVCSGSSHANEPVQDEQPLSPAQLIKADMQRQQDYDDDDHRPR